MAAPSRRRPSLGPSGGEEHLMQHAKPTICVSLDIGTYGSGFGYRSSLSRQGLQLHTAWPDRPPHVPDTYPKTRSALLLRGSHAVAFGWAAERQYNDMDEQKRKDERYRLVYGREFKLGLMDRDPTVATAAEAHLVEFLRLLRRYVVTQLAAASPAHASGRLVRWCLTVPAMWHDGAKAAVRRAAHRAGLTSRLDSDELTVVLEPEAAALQVALGSDRPTLTPLAVFDVSGAASRSLSHSLSRSGSGSQSGSSSQGSGGGGGGGVERAMRPGELFLVLDVGGGTVDSSVHEVEERGDTAVLSETQAVPAVGALWGSTNIDSDFEKYYASQVGEQRYEQWKVANPREWEDVMSEWDKIKCRFDGVMAQELAPAGPMGGSAGSPEGDGDEEWEQGRDVGNMPRVPIPPGLYCTLDENKKINLRMEQELIDDSVLLPCHVLERVFRDTVEGVRGLALQQLAAVAAAGGGAAAAAAGAAGAGGGARCSKLLLVGGFASSPYLQLKLREALRQGAAAPGGAQQQARGAAQQQQQPLVRSMVLPERPAAAVLQGAVLYAERPELIRARASRQTYGVRTAVPYEEGMPGKFWHPTELSYFSSLGFSPFVKRGQLVGADEEVTHVFTPLSDDQEIATVELWASHETELPWLPALAEGGGEEAAGEQGAVAHRVAELQVLLLDPGSDSDDDGPSTSSAANNGANRRGGGGGGSGVGRRSAASAAATSGSEGGEEQQRLIEVSLAFGRTEIKVSARDVLRNRSVNTRFRFAFC